tara:strand:+ start:1114 stop:1662 length:549 start_codon:yes stop_codon:yes gene_type:complete
MLPTQQEVDSLISMIMVQLPFPPVPVMAINGNGSDSICSSHDLLSRAIACNMMPDNQTEHDKYAAAEERLRVVMALNQANAENYPDGWSDKRDIEDIYGMYGHFFRQYMSHYRGSPDLRIMPLESVDKDSIVLKQARQHALARMRIMGTTDADQQSDPINTYSYTKLLRLYALDLYSERQDG